MILYQDETQNKNPTHISGHTKSTAKKHKNNNKKLQQKGRIIAVGSRRSMKDLKTTTTKNKNKQTNYSIDSSGFSTEAVVSGFERPDRHTGSPQKDHHSGLVMHRQHRTAPRLVPFRGHSSLRSQTISHVTQGMNK